MNLLPQFSAYIKAHHLFSPKDKLLLAVSGGVDSVVLCELCKLAGYNFAIAHCNFKLRGEESERDEKFVKSLEEKYSVEVKVKKFGTEKYAEENKLSIQEAARKLRYDWFSELLTTHDSRLTTILTAHHADDNIETVLMNFFKGTGIAGLRGMLPRQEKIVRPLLFAKKEEIISFAKEHQLKWVEDSSNLSDKYSRNYFRNQLIPLIQKIYPETENNLSDNLQRFADIEILYQQAIALHKKNLLEKKGDEVHIPLLKLKKSTPLRTIVFEIIIKYGFTPGQVDEVIALLDSDSGKFIQSFSHRIIKNRNWLIISPNQTLLAENILIEEGTDEVEFAKGKLKFQNIPMTEGQKFPDSSMIALLNAEKVQFPLFLRKWKQGDYFYPLGMKKKKKLSRFFIDQKLSKTEKEKVWVLEMDKKIAWVIGMRIDERFKVKEKTKSFLKISLLQP